MSWFARFFKKPKAEEPAPTSASTERRWLTVQELAEKNRDVIKGWRLSVTMNTNVPLYWLLRHGEIAEDPQPILQEYGGWLPVVKSFAELGINLPELPKSTMASQIGQIPQDGGDFLPFLIEYRTIIEGATPRAATLRRLNDLEEKYPDIAAITHPQGIVKSFILSDLYGLQGCGPKTADRLYGAGYRSADEVRDLTLEQLTSIDGIGVKTAKKLLEH